MRKIQKRWILIIIGIALFLIGGWFLTTEYEKIWPLRNTIQYQLLDWWWEQVGQPTTKHDQTGILRGSVQDEQGNPIAKAIVLVAWWDGTTYSARTDEQGNFIIRGIPAGTYRPVTSAPGYEDQVLGSYWRGLHIIGNEETSIEIVLSPRKPRPVTPGKNLILGNPRTVRCQQPIESQAHRQQITFEAEGQLNQLSYLYTPLMTEQSPSEYPTLLAVYPSAAEEWECATLPLVAAGYVVVAIGPAYSLELERDIDDLERLLNFIRAEKFPYNQGDKVAILGGSYSGLHVMRLLQRDQEVQAALLLGAPTDLFDMRRRQEQGSFVAPYGLDQALIALGLPNRHPLRYWRYSGGYHIYPDMPPTLIMHSRNDEIIPYQQSQFLAEQLERAGVPYEAHFFEGGEHYLLAEDDKARELFDLTINFLAKHLK